MPWDTLGYQGRTFAGLGPSPADIEKVTCPRAGAAGAQRHSPPDRLPLGHHAQCG
ncbi:MAG TPA: hypothetical protein VF825_04160 [Oryzihumus sp.]